MKTTSPTFSDDLDQKTQQKTFPTASLPSSARAFVEEQAAALPVQPDMVAAPVLVTLAAAIGNGRTICVKPGWKEPCSLYVAVISETGTMKSPALATATLPLTCLQTEQHRTWAGDITVERLGQLQKVNSRGLMIYRDELSGFFRGLNQYKGGKGSDKEYYLSAWSGQSGCVDRKGKEGISEYLNIPRPNLNIVGGIPPEVLRELTGGIIQSDGFLQRFLFAWSEPMPVRWTNSTLSDSTKKMYYDLVTALHNLEPRDESEPRSLSMTPRALDVFKAWHDKHCAETETLTNPELKGFFAKLKGICPRLALIHGLGSNPEAVEIGPESVEAAILQVAYFKGQAAKVVDALTPVGVGSVGATDTKIEKCRKAIIRQFQDGKRLKRRDIQRTVKYPKDTFKTAWESLTQPLLSVDDDGRYGLRENNPSEDTRSDIPTSDTTDETDEMDIEDDQGMEVRLIKGEPRSRARACRPGRQGEREAHTRPESNPQESEQQSEVIRRGR